MVENEFYINRKYTMRVNFNLKTVGNKSQIWLTTTIDKQRARVFTKLLIEPQYWLKTTRTQIGERATEDPAIGTVQLRYNKEVNKALKQILSYCNDYAKAITERKKEEYKEVISFLKRGYSVRNTAKLSSVSVSTVQRVKREFSL